MPKVVPGSKRDQVEERAKRVFEHRRGGGSINRQLAVELAKEGFTDPYGFPLTVETLCNDYREYVKHEEIFHRETYQSFGTLQRMRLERNLSILDKHISVFDVEPDPELGAAGVPIIPPQHIYMLTTLAKEMRQTIAEISKLTGSNAPTEVVITQRLESEVQNILAILQQGLDEEVFQLVAQCLAKGLGLAKERSLVVDDGMAIPGWVEDPMLALEPAIAPSESSE